MLSPQEVVIVSSTTGSQATASQRILVVDDEPSIVDAVATSLHYEGFDVARASTGQAALERPRSNAPT